MRTGGWWWLGLWAACGTEPLELVPRTVTPRGHVEAALSVDCGQSTNTGYSNGSPFTITVVHIDGKPVEAATANAYCGMAQAAAAQGVGLQVSSGFRTMAEQEYFYNCYLTKSCNNGNLAAKPGYSNHQSGHALDLNTSAGGVYAWLSNHAAEYGFQRTVPSEAWHWEWWGGGPGGGCCGGCAPHCEGTVIVDAGCGKGDCGAFGAICLMNGAGVPYCQAPVCTAHCEGALAVDVYCQKGDCGAFGATCQETAQGPKCVVPACTPHCEGSVIVDAGCGKGDCAAFGAGCVHGPSGPQCVLSCTPHCEGNVIIDAACQAGDCGAFGLGCEMAGGVPTCVGSCTPHCEGTVAVDGKCQKGDCGAFGASCVMKDGAPTCVTPCTPHCEGNIVVDAVCQRGDCSAFGATCAYDQGAPKCVVGCKPHCAGPVIVGADCAEGDCSAFGLDCINNGDGPACGTPQCARHCEGSQIVQSNCSKGDCGAFGLTCVDYGFGAECGYGACTPHCAGTVVVDASCNQGDCGVFGALCSTLGGYPHCVSSFCVPNADTPPWDHDICIGDKRYHCDGAGGMAETPCPAGMSCNACGDCGPTPAEVCNYQDDDCDGQIDEGVTNACGQCGPAPAEACNAKDDDCDGEVDEGVLNACGKCGATPPESCNYQDDDCDGETDEGVLNACGACGPAPAEACNAKDDDCDGETDEGFGVGEACKGGDGTCVQAGVRVCLFGAAGDGATTCAVPELPCDDGDVCTIDECNLATGCVHLPSPDCQPEPDPELAALPDAGASDAETAPVELDAGLDARDEPGDVASDDLWPSFDASGDAGTPGPGADITVALDTGHSTPPGDVEADAAAGGDGSVTTVATGRRSEGGCAAGAGSDAGASVAAFLLALALLPFRRRG